jgi:PAS domain S-box-containing protein
MALVGRVLPAMIASGNRQWDDSYPNAAVFQDDIEKGQLWVAEDAGLIVGVAAITTDQEPEYAEVGWDPSELAVVVHRLAVDPVAQGQGIAKALMRQAEVVARARGIPVLRVDTHTQNAATQRLFPKLGYSLAGEIGLGFRPGMRFCCYEKRLSCLPEASGRTDPAADEIGLLRRRMEVLEVVLDESTDPIFNILEDGTYRYVNRAFSGPFGREPEEVIGRRIWDLFAPEEAKKRMKVVQQAFATRQAIVFDVRVPTAAGDTFYITSVKPILDPGGRVTSVVCMSKNITERKKVEAEREELIRRLQTALQEIHTLSGLLPICAHCKRIRDGHGHWTQIEQYIRSHSQADFTHGVCPDCSRDFFPEVP